MQSRSQHMDIIICHIQYLKQNGHCNSARCIDQTRRLWFTAASIKEANSGCGSNGRDFSSG